ncbi:MAG: hypothetical protein MUO26_00455 [Methanotrichaceae archaeon]|nr:hypothetical protein [Methanotrichaceae archaeon]
MGGEGNALRTGYDYSFYNDKDLAVKQYGEVNFYSNERMDNLEKTSSFNPKYQPDGWDVMPDS